MRFFILVFICNLNVLASSQVNYCGSKVCQHTNAHTFCQISVGVGARCSGYIEAPLSVEEQTRVISRLNQRRAAVAAGRLKGFPTAGNMMKLLWIDELAREAQLWADQCAAPAIPEENDKCRDLYSVTVGQCVASVVGEAPGLRPESMVDVWYMQSRHYKGNITSYSPPSNEYVFYGDFAQLVYARTYMVGCGRSKFMTLVKGRLRSVERLVCNFAPRGPNAGRPMWTEASPATSCPPRSLPDVTQPALCAIQPDLYIFHDQDKVMPLEEHILIDTMLDVKRNESLNYVGSIDELYLTKMAIAKIMDPATNEVDNSSSQKTDVDKIVDIFFNPAIEKPSISSLSDALTHEHVSSTFIPKEKLVLVGRLKSYNIDELNDVDSNKENSYIPSVTSPNKNFDIDYELIERSKGTESTIEDTTTKRTITQALRELQEELNIMENTPPNMTITSTKIIDKVRRDLRDFPLTVKAKSNNDKKTVVPTSTHLSKEFSDLDITRTFDQSLMISILLRYLPFLKKYKNILMNCARTNCDINFRWLLLTLTVFVINVY